MLGFVDVVELLSAELRAPPPGAARGLWALPLSDFSAVL